MNKEEIKNLLKETVKLNDSSYDYEIHGLSGKHIEELTGYGTIENIDGFEIKYEDDFGGEGDGDSYWLVISILELESNEKTYIRFNGYYDSWNGTEWEDWQIVNPKEVSVIQWVV